MDTSQTVTFYGVHLPNSDTSKMGYVFLNKTEALKEVKKYKKARFKTFQFFDDAMEFSQHGSECPNNNSSVEINPSKNEIAQSVGEKFSQFRGPKSQDLVKLRKGIENGDIEFVRSTIWENPRYLISNGDTPSILQEGSRYNAVHVAAKSKDAQMCSLILSTIDNPAFLQLLYGEENHINAEEASKILLDLYLNTPDKGLNETPLHFAVKYGAVEVVEVLVSYPSCDKNVLNKYSHSPKDMICTRTINPSASLKETIENLLQDQFYVPVLRSEDNCIQPFIGQPFSPSSPPCLNTNPIDPRMEIHAFAGPMKKEAAGVFHKKWKTPPRVHYTPNTPVRDSPGFDSYKTESDIRLQDNEKGLERVGRHLALKFNVGWKEYWPFLGSFVDLRSRDGLFELERYLKDRFLGSSQYTLDFSFDSIISPITELCNRFGAFCINDTKTLNHIKKKPEITVVEIANSGLTPCLCIEKSCQVLSNRIALYITNQKESVTKQTLTAFESEIKHLRSLISSFMGDPTYYNTVNVQTVHSRIAHLISNKLKQLLDEQIDEKYRHLELILRKYREFMDEYSSDEDIKLVTVHVTSDGKEVQCLVEQILKSLRSDRIDGVVNVLSEEECVDLWNQATPCDCRWKLTRTKNDSYGKKTKSFSMKQRPSRNLDNVSRRLTFTDDELVLNDTQYEMVKNDNSPDEFHSLENSESSDSDDDGLFEDADSSTYMDIYIDGNHPTKMDYAVFNILVNVKITPEDYPHIYRWRHSMKLFPEEEKHRWPSPNAAQAPLVSTPRTEGKKPVVYTSPQSWLRVTGQNSPMRSLQALKRWNDV